MLCAVRHWRFAKHTRWLLITNASQIVLPASRTCSHHFTSNRLETSRKPVIVSTQRRITYTQPVLTKRPFNIIESRFLLTFWPLPLLTKQYKLVLAIGWEGNRRSGVALAMRHRLDISGISTYGLNALGKWDELHSEYYGIFTFTSVSVTACHMFHYTSKQVSAAVTSSYCFLTNKFSISLITPEKSM